MQYVKFINETTINIAPTNYKTENGNIIFNFNTSPDTMTKYEYYPLIEVSEMPIIKPYQTLSKTYVLNTKEVEDEEGNKTTTYEILEQYNIVDDILKYKQYLLGLLEVWYTKQEQELIPINDYFVKLEWFNTYSNAYNALKFAEENLIGIQPSEVIVATSEQLYKNIIVSSSKELAPLYQAVMVKYNEVIPQRNKLLVDIQDAIDIPSLDLILNNLSTIIDI